MNTKKYSYAAMQPKYLNIACGGTYIASAEWENVDYTPHDRRHVKGMNVLHGLNPSQTNYEAIYCSHFIEHIPLASIASFLERCRALLAPDGVFRIVVPDAEFLLREYLKHKEAGDDALANFAYEPPRFLRRRFCLSHAAMAWSSRQA